MATFNEALDTVRKQNRTNRTEAQRESEAERFLKNAKYDKLIELYISEYKTITEAHWFLSNYLGRVKPYHHKLRAYIDRQFHSLNNK